MIIKLKNDSFLLKLLVFFTPFSYMPIFDYTLGVPGLKLFNLLALLLLLVFLLKGGLLTSFDDNDQAKASMFLVVYVLLFSIAFFRTFFEFNDLPMQIRDALGGGGKIQFFLSYYVKPLLFIVSCAYIIRFVKTESAINNVIAVIVASATVFSVIIVIIGLDNLLSFSGVRGRNELRGEFHYFLGMHYNTVATMLVLAFPLSIYVSKLQHSISSSLFFRFAPLALFAAGVVTQSRTAILLIVMSLIVVQIIKPANAKTKARKLMIMIVGVVVGITVALPFLAVFFDAGGPGSDPVDYLLSGRVLSMWIPLSEDLGSSTFKFLFGYGLYGMMQSDVFFTPGFFQASHAHNAYLNFVADTGMVGLVPLLFIAFAFLKKIYSKREALESGLLTYLFTVLVMYLYAGLTERSFFPAYDNFWLFPIVALSISAYRIAVNNK